MSDAQETSSGPTPEVPLEIRVRWEIWHSFVSLLRSYAAAVSTEATPYTVHSFSDWAKVEYQQRAVRFCFNPSTGDAVWREIRPEMETWGEFHINEDGTFSLSGGTTPIDMAAIDWIESLGKESLFDDSVLTSLGIAPESKL